jgi:hypothetical protein
MRRGIIELVLAGQRPRQPELRIGGFGIGFERPAKIILGLLRRARVKLGLRQVEACLELGGLLLRGGFEQRQRLGRLLVVQQKHARVQLGFEQARLQIQGLAVFHGGFRIPVQIAVGQRQVEMRKIILGIGGDGRVERLNGGFELALPQSLLPVRDRIGRLQEKQRQCHHPHNPILLEADAASL